MCGIFSFGRYLAIHWGQTCSAVSGLPPQKMQDRALPSESMADKDEQPTQPTQPKGRDKDGKPYEPVEIPVPTEGDVMDLFESVAHAPADAGEK